MNAFQSTRSWYRSPLSLAIASTLALVAAAPVVAQENSETQAGPAIASSVVPVTTKAGPETSRSASDRPDAFAPRSRAGRVTSRR